MPGKTFRARHRGRLARLGEIENTNKEKDARNGSSNLVEQNLIYLPENVFYNDALEIKLRRLTSFAKSNDVSQKPSE